MRAVQEHNVKEGGTAGYQKGTHHEELTDECILVDVQKLRLQIVKGFEAMAGTRHQFTFLLVVH